MTESFPGYLSDNSKFRYCERINICLDRGNILKRDKEQMTSEGWSLYMERNFWYQPVYHVERRVERYWRINEDGKTKPPIKSMFWNEPGPYKAGCVEERLQTIGK